MLKQVQHDGSGEGVAAAFAPSAARLAGFAGAHLGWSPDAFWRATPAELGAVLVVLAGDVSPPPDAVLLQDMMRRHPD